LVSADLENIKNFGNNANDWKISKNTANTAGQVLLAPIKTEKLYFKAKKVLIFD